MLRPRGSQKDFFDEYVYGSLIPSDHELWAIDQEVDFSFIEDEIAGLYSEGTGRSSYPAEVLFRMLFWEYYANL